VITAGFKGLVMLLYTPTTSPSQETRAQEVRSDLGDALPYAPRARPVAAVGCSVAALAVIFYVVCVAYTVLRLWGIVL
jgi:hypothetical protein